MAKRKKENRPLDLLCDIRNAASDGILLIGRGQRASQRDSVELEEVLAQLNTIVSRIEEEEATDGN